MASPAPRRSASLGLLVTAATLLLTSPAPAVPLNYTIGSGSVTANTTEPGLVINTAVDPSVAGTSVTLDDAGTYTFSFFNIWTNEPKIKADDLAPLPISATLNFTDPFTGATIDGITVGGKWLQGLSQWGQVNWDGPVTVNVPGDRSFEISLSDATFNYGFGGLNEGTLCGATVSATITQISSVTPFVPPIVPPFVPPQNPPPNQPPDNPPSNPPGNPPPVPTVPEGGKTALLLAGGLVTLRFLARNRRTSRV